MNYRSAFGGSETCRQCGSHWYWIKGHCNRCGHSEEPKRLEDGDPCPKCETGHLEHHRHRFSSDRGPNMPDADWLACDECDFHTDPE